MGPAGRAQITFTLAASASRATEKQLRHWLDKAQVSLQGDDERVEGQWRRFSLIDVVRLGIINALVGYGVPVVQAAEIINARNPKDGAFRPDGSNLTFNNFSIEQRLRDYADFTMTPRRMIDSALRGMMLVISTDTGAPDQPNDTEFQVGSFRCRLGFDPAKNPSMSSRGFAVAPKPDTTDLRHFILIDVGQIARDVLARLDADDGDDGNDKTENDNEHA